MTLCLKNDPRPELVVLVRGSEMIQRIKTYYNNMTGFNMRQNEQKYTFFYFVHINT